ncbi:uncharacterized protein LOC128559784 isoform X2 [Mercenaria mercenaria]|uniref:uncharacterized protein LOC128559784 isoform X2 n=1 Tax=Mercenaria mercenaria TaxID=6596 RepID=UPI00234F2E75|nr:uncharacterized protein LOC128559784 isoform X2 [Mercenaria mercenaria]
MSEKKKLNGDNNKPKDSWFKENDDYSDKDEKIKEKELSPIDKLNKNKHNATKRPTNSNKVDTVHLDDGKHGGHSFGKLIREAVARLYLKQQNTSSNDIWNAFLNELLVNGKQMDIMKAEIFLRMNEMEKMLLKRINSMASENNNNFQDIRKFMEHFRSGWHRQQAGNQASVAVNTDPETEERNFDIPQAQETKPEPGLEGEQKEMKVKDTSRMEQSAECQAPTNDQTDRSREIEDICVRVVNRLMNCNQYQQIHQQAQQAVEVSTYPQDLHLTCSSHPPQAFDQSSTPSLAFCCSCTRCICFCHSKDRSVKNKSRRNKRRLFGDNADRKHKDWKRKTEVTDEEFETNPPNGDLTHGDLNEQNGKVHLSKSLPYPYNSQGESKGSNEYDRMTEYLCQGEWNSLKFGTNLTSNVSDSDVPQDESYIRKKKAPQYPDRKSAACGGGNPGDPSDGSDSEDDLKKGDGKDDRGDNGKKSDGDEERHIFDWKIDVDSWKECILEGDEEKVEQLLRKKILPDDNLLQEAKEKFGRKSKTFSDICKKISVFVGKQSEEIVDVWPAFKYKKDCDNDEKVLFVVCTAKKVENIDINTYETDQRCITETQKNENQIIREREQENPFDDEEMKQIVQCMKDNSVTLMDIHSNITRISVSWIKSKGYGTELSSMNHELCIVLYVHIKGLIPINEDPFPTNVGIYSVDIREGVFLPLAGPFEHHEQIKMGCAIRGDFHTGGGVGTLGGFVEHNNNIYCITSAHVMFEKHHFEHLQKNKLILFGPHHQYFAYQPTKKEAKPFGKITKAVYTEGGGGAAGVEAVLICVDERCPSSGNFPDGKNYREAGFDNGMSYTSGKTLEMADLPRRTDVIKYGIYSHVTRGCFRLDGASIRNNNALGTIHNLGFLLHNQIEIEEIGHVRFAEPGDSGALVMTEEENGDLVAIGLLEGEMDGIYIVTPICDVLAALGIPRNQGLKRFGPLTVSTNRLNEQSQHIPTTQTNATPDSGISISSQNSPERNDFLQLVSKVDNLSDRFSNVEQDLPQDVARHAAENNYQMTEKLKAMETDLQHQFMEHRKQYTEIKDQMTGKINAMGHQLQQQFEEHRKQNTDQMTEKMNAMGRQLQQQSEEHKKQNIEIKDQMTDKINAMGHQLQQQFEEHRKQNTDQMTEKMNAMEYQLQQQSEEHKKQNTEIKDEMTEKMNAMGDQLQQKFEEHRKQNTDQMTEKMNAMGHQLQQQSEEQKKQNTEIKDQMDAMGRQLERKYDEQNQEIKQQMGLITELLMKMNQNKA